MQASNPRGPKPGAAYVVVSSDTHAAPDDFDEYLYYVDPTYRQAIADHGTFDEMQVPERYGLHDSGAFGGVTLPPMSIDSGVRGYSDDYFEPFWHAREQHDMVLHLHTGHIASDMAHLYDAQRGGFIGTYEVFVFTRRPIWFMILGGVFDRHPRLRLGIAENGIHWIPSYIRDMEIYFDQYANLPVKQYLQLRPSEYFERNLFYGASLLQRMEVDMRHEIGVHKIMWGSDYPHFEGTAPFSRLAMAHVLGGLPESEIRQILGQNAIDLWGFDAALLQRAADRCGPTVEDLARPVEATAVPRHFSWSYADVVPARQSAP